MDDERWEDLNNFKTCPLCGTEGALFVDILEEANKDAEQLAALQAENERLRSALEKAHILLINSPQVMNPEYFTSPAHRMLHEIGVALKGGDE